VSSQQKIDVGVVLGAGRELDVHQAVSIPDFGSYSFSTPADVALSVRRLGRGLEIEGTADVTASGQCARCLDDVRLPLHLEIDERLDPDRERDDPLGENNVLVGDELDVGDLVRQVIDSALPLVLHCTDDCGGLCPDCGNTRNGACRCPRITE
jgi:uncharacterized protein